MSFRIVLTFPEPASCEYSFIESQTQQQLQLNIIETNQLIAKIQL